MEWNESPVWATHKLTLAGGTSLWATESSKEVVVGTGENEQKIEVVAVEQRPEWKTKVFLMDEGKLVQYEAEGRVSHNEAKRMLKSSGYDIRGFRFMLEYVQIV